MKYRVMTQTIKPSLAFENVMHACPHDHHYKYCPIEFIP